MSIRRAHKTLHLTHTNNGKEKVPSCAGREHKGEGIYRVPDLLREGCVKHHTQRTPTTAKKKVPSCADQEHRGEGIRGV